MDTNLVVIRPFGGRSRGDLVADPAQVAAIVAGENSLDVVRVNAAPAAPAALAPLAGG